MLEPKSAILVGGTATLLAIGAFALFLESHADRAGTTPAPIAVVSAASPAAPAHALAVEPQPAPQFLSGGIETLAAKLAGGTADNVTVALDGVDFVPGRLELGSNSRASVDRLAALLIEYPASQIQLEVRPNSSEADATADARGDRLASELIARGVPANRIGIATDASSTQASAPVAVRLTLPKMRVH